jgi:flagellar biosynthesis protein FlhG
MMNTRPRVRGPVLLGVSSGKGGVGKTSLTVNLSYALAQLGPKVLVVDGDLGLANVDVLLGLTVRTTMRDILDKGLDPLETLIYPEPNWAILPATSGVTEMVDLGPDDQNYLKGILQSLAAHFDFVLVDMAAGIGSSVLWFNTFVEHNIIILSPDPTSMTDAYALIKVLKQSYNRQEFFLVLNSVKDENEGRKVYEHLAKVAEKFLQIQLKYLGAIPWAEEVRKAVREQAPFLKIFPQCKASKAVLALAERIRQMR